MGAPPTGAAPQSKTWLWVLLGCLGCGAIGGIGVVALGAIGFLTAAREASVSAPVAVYATPSDATSSSSTPALEWKTAAKDCKETCQRVIACEKQLATDEGGGESETQADCEKDCGPKMDDNYTCMSKAGSCDDLFECGED